MGNGGNGGSGGGGGGGQADYAHSGDGGSNGTDGGTWANATATKGGYGGTGDHKSKYLFNDPTLELFCGAGGGGSYSVYPGEGGAGGGGAGGMVVSSGTVPDLRKGHPATKYGGGGGGAGARQAYTYNGAGYQGAVFIRVAR